MVKAYQYHQQPVSIETSKKFEEIIDRYPEYFKWEHTYKSIPKEVHEAFNKEAYPERYKPFEIKTPNDFTELQKGAVYKQMTLKDWEDFVNHIGEKQDKENEYKKNIIKIWDKHYNKFDIDCPEF